MTKPLGMTGKLWSLWISFSFVVFVSVRVLAEDFFLFLYFATFSLIQQESLFYRDEGPLRVWLGFP